MADFLKVKIISPKGDVFEGEATAVSSTNLKGKFDILPGHANFVTIVRDKPVTVATKEGRKVEYLFNSAVVHAANDSVDIFTDLSESELRDIV